MITYNFRLFIFSPLFFFCETDSLQKDLISITDISNLSGVINQSNELISDAFTMERCVTFFASNGYQPIHFAITTDKRVEPNNQNSKIFEWIHPTLYNPSKNINFSISDKNNLTFQEHTLPSQIVEMLIGNDMSPKNYPFGSETRNLISTIYFHQLTVNNFS